MPGVRDKEAGVVLLSLVRSKGPLVVVVAGSTEVVVLELSESSSSPLQAPSARLTVASRRS